MVNAYLTECTDILVKAGGEVAKYVGDCVMAYFNYDMADPSIQAGLDILKRLAHLRAQAPAASPLRFLFTGIGIACGEVVEGNIGSSSKKEYTVIGDAVNQAASLEALTRRLPRTIAISAGVKKLTTGSLPFISMGRHRLKEGHEATEVFSVDKPGVSNSRNPMEHIEWINRTWKKVKATTV